MAAGSEDEVPLLEIVDEGYQKRKRVPAGEDESSKDIESLEENTPNIAKRVSSSKLYVWSLILLYIMLNSTLNLANRYALGMIGFSYPISLTCTHMLFSFVVLSPYFFSGERRAKSIAVLKRAWKGIMCIGFFLALNISLNNASLVGMTLVLNQIVRSGIPVVTAVLAIFIEGKTPTTNRAIGLFPICIGVVCSIYEGSKMQGTVPALILCIAGMFSNALMMTISGRVMEEKIDAIQLACFTAPVSLTVLVYHFIIHEANDIYNHINREPFNSGLVLLGTSVLALSYNIVHYQVIKATSAVTTTVLGNVKIVLIVFLSGLLFGETSTWSIRMVVGATITFIGFFIYSWAGLEDKRNAVKTDQGKKLRGK